MGKQFLRQKYPTQAHLQPETFIVELKELIRNSLYHNNMHSNHKFLIILHRTLIKGFQVLIIQYLRVLSLQTWANTAKEIKATRTNATY